MTVNLDCSAEMLFIIEPATYEARPMEHVITVMAFRHL